MAPEVGDGPHLEEVQSCTDSWTSRASVAMRIPRSPWLAVHPQGRIVTSLPLRWRRLLPNGVVLRRRSRMFLCSMQLQMGSCLNRTVHSSLLGCVICMGWTSQPTACLLSLKAPCFLTIGNRMRGFDACEQGRVFVQRRRQRRSHGQGKEGKECEDKKRKFCFFKPCVPGRKESFF